MKHRLVVDGQLFQTPAWHRGMGKYSLELLAGINKTKKVNFNTIEIILSSKLVLEDEALALINKRLPDANIVFLELEANEIGNNRIPEANRLIIDKYISKILRYDEKIVFLISSIMQGEICPVYPSMAGIHKTVIFYDLIPLMFHKLYLDNPITRMEYLSKFKELFKTDVFLAISKTVANDISMYLGVDKDRVVSIDGGPIRHADNQQKLNIDKPFVLMPTGNDLRKNNRRAIIAFDKVNRKYNRKYSLVITSYFKDEQLDELKALSADIIFTGNISGEEINYLYAKCTALLFPSEYEGLGLPVLEAIEYKKPIACSDIPVFREISDDAFFYFDPYSVIEIESSIDNVLTKEINTSAYTDISKRYTWAVSSKKFYQSIGLLKTNKSLIQKKPIAIYGVDPSNDSYYGKFILENHAELSRYFDIDYVIEACEPNKRSRIDYLPYVSNYTELSRGTKINSSQYELIVYNIFNSRHCVNTILNALSSPGLIILHDINLETLWQELLERKLIDPSRMVLEQTIESKLPKSKSKFISSLIASQKGVIVFSQKDKDIVNNIAKRVNKDIVISTGKLPTNSIVYEISKPKKDVLSQNDTIERFKTDFEYYRYLNNATSLYIEGLNQYKICLEAMSFGVLPIVPSVGKFTEIPSNLIINYESSRYLQQVADREDDLGLRKKIIAYIQRDHSQKGYTNLVLNLIDSIGGNVGL